MDNDYLTKHHLNLTYKILPIILSKHINPFTTSRNDYNTDNDFLRKIGVPKIEYIDLIFLLKYKFYEYSIRPFSSIWRLEIKIESVHISPNDPMRYRLVSISYEASNYFKEYLTTYEDPKGYICFMGMADRIVKCRNQITTLLIAPLEDMPLHINDPEPFCELAAWRLMLPKISVDYGSSEYSFWNQTRLLITL